MGRLKHFGEHRFVGTREDMVVYDCDDDENLRLLEEKAAALVGLNLIQTFGPDDLAEARNRGFSPA
ncbi:MAG: hypothetical protein QNL12_01205 [Acidimicrobiia bacterium]|nr:hypothetical protein [Acidimicrobiia bacterium]MDX2465904.1 hypothetical protein [Acidimicrobiia bacterium]